MKQNQVAEEKLLIPLRTASDPETGKHGPLPWYKMTSISTGSDTLNKIRSISLHPGLLFTSTSTTSVCAIKMLAILVVVQQQKQTLHVCQECNAFLEFIEQRILCRVIIYVYHILKKGTDLYSIQH